MATVIEVFKALEPVMDPEHPISITHPKMSIVTQEYIEVEGNTIGVKFKPTVPYCPMGGLIGVMIRHRLETVYPENEIKVALLPGSHSLEAQVNDMINDDQKYNQIIEQMKNRGMM
ncbi:MAG: iron-sulfur cluster assembly protein [Candidatus Thorarchaeota archaeon]